MCATTGCASATASGEPSAFVASAASIILIVAGGSEWSIGPWLGTAAAALSLRASGQNPYKPEAQAREVYPSLALRACVSAPARSFVRRLLALQRRLLSPTSRRLQLGEPPLAMAGRRPAVAFPTPRRPPEDLRDVPGAHVE